MNHNGELHRGYDGYPYIYLVRSIQDWFQKEDESGNNCGFSCILGEDSIIATILIPCMYHTCKEMNGKFHQIFIDGTSGFMVSPKIHITWIHTIDEEGNSRIIGQILTSRKTTQDYKAGLELWKNLLTKVETEVQFNDEREGTFRSSNFTAIQGIDVEVMMSDREDALLNACRNILSPNLQLLCRFHVLQAISRKVPFI